MLCGSGGRPGPWVPDESVASCLEYIRSMGGHIAAEVVSKIWRNTPRYCFGLPEGKCKVVSDVLEARCSRTYIRTGRWATVAWRVAHLPSTRMVENSQ